MAWTGASGGAGTAAGHGLGPLLAWECASILLQVDIEDVGAHVAELAWFAWDAFEPQTGWSLRLAIEDPAKACAWAVAATDHVRGADRARDRGRGWRTDPRDRAARTAWNASHRG